MSLAGISYVIGRYHLCHWPVILMSLAGITYVIGRYGFSIRDRRDHKGLLLMSLAGILMSLAGITYVIGRYVGT